ncbi:AraC family transcriptional regulator [Streptomyces galbus]|uniref:AraC family transcriptional regulator n=1 Tax=Streptomyces galbus TaxID=33898 RepID=A0A4U5W210_STRGB|nr:helix-turn-helix domain-containing protein [Streptomyces galbus]TKS95386.1 AraC family transcriptional regulator [Streptomyces galbus]
MRCAVDRDRGWETARELPDERARPGVLQYRGFRMTLDEPRRRLEVPAGVVTLVLGFEEHRLLLTDTRSLGSDSATVARPYTSLLSALRTRASFGEHSGSLYGMEVVLAPWAAYTLFGIPMGEWADSILDPADLVGSRVEGLARALADLPDWARRFELLDTALGRWFAEGPGCSPRVVWAWQELCRTGGTVPIHRLAARTGWGTRQLENRFRQQIGLPPKTVARVLRLRRALRSLHHGRTAALTALSCGYSDQAHMSREVRRMTGLPPSRLMAARAFRPAGPPTNDRVDGQVTSFGLPR